MKLEIASDVANLLGPDGVARSRSGLAGPVRCMTCGGEIRRSQVASLVVTRDSRARRLVANFAHASCSRSQIIDAPVAADRGVSATPITWICATRPRRLAVLAWEFHTSLKLHREEPAEDLDLVGERFGFTKASAELAVLDAPETKVVVVRVTADDAVELVDPLDRAPLQRFEGLGAHDPRGAWRASVKRDGACLAMFGFGLGLGESNPADLQAGVDGGRVRAARLRLMSAPR